jgi:hypothetical protein
MGEARRRKRQLGELYGTPEGSNRGLVAYQGFSQEELDQKALARIKAAKAAGQKVVLMAASAANPLAQAAGLPWLHELGEGEPIPSAIAYSLEAAEVGGPIIDPVACEGAVLIIGAGVSEWLRETIASSIHK